MKKVFSLILLALLAAGDVLAGDTLEVNLPELQGLYSESGIYLRHCSFLLDRIPASVDRVSFRILGWTNVGQMMCSDPDTGEPEGPYPWRMSVSASMLDSTTGYIWNNGGLTPSQAGAFELVKELFPLAGGHPTWNFLLSRHGTVDLSAWPINTINDCWGLVDPDVTVVEATLMIEGAFQVGVEATSWGAIKSLYVK